MYAEFKEIRGQCPEAFHALKSKENLHICP